MGLPSSDVLSLVDDATEMAVRLRLAGAADLTGMHASGAISSSAEEHPEAESSSFISVSAGLVH